MTENTPQNAPSSSILAPSAPLSEGQGWSNALSPSFWENKTVLVTGAHGFLGSHIVNALKALPVRAILAPTRSELDLTRSPFPALPANIDILIHCAGKVGGLLANMEHQAEFLAENTLMGLGALEMARLASVPRVVMASSSCAYPKSCHAAYTPFMLHEGAPASGNLGYGLAKRLLIEAGSLYRAQYGMNVSSIVLPNLYGPGNNYSAFTGHVIGALIGKMVGAKAEGLAALEMVGTGSARREFLFIDDAAEALLWAAEHADGPVLNMGPGDAIAVRDLAEEIQRGVGFGGALVWPEFSPEHRALDGQDKKVMNSAPAHEMGWAPRVGLKEGLALTVAACPQPAPVNAPA